MEMLKFEYNPKFPNYQISSLKCERVHIYARGWSSPSWNCLNFKNSNPSFLFTFIKSNQNNLNFELNSKFPSQSLSILQFNFDRHEIRKDGPTFLHSHSMLKIKNEIGFGGKPAVKLSVTFFPETPPRPTQICACPSATSRQKRTSSSHSLWRLTSSDQFSLSCKTKRISYPCARNSNRLVSTHPPNLQISVLAQYF